MQQEPASQVIVALLGTVSTRRNGELVPLPGARARTLLAALAAQPGRSRTAVALVDDVWGDDPPRAPMNALHTQVSRLRSALPDGALEAGPAGYRLALQPGEVDVSRARELAAAARRRQAGGDPRGALETVAAARDLWRGEPGADLSGGAVATTLAAQAAAGRDALDDVELAARRDLGDAAGVLELARARAQRAPLDESVQAALMRALVAVGRATEALDVFATVRARLADELGADPGPELVDLNTAVLRGETAAPTAKPTAVGLRAAPNELLGRADDLVRIEKLLTTARVVTVLGPGGTGKTRIAHELGRRAAAGMSVALVELAALRSGDDVLAAVVATLGISESDLASPGIRRPSGRSARERLRAAVRFAPILLILDNCEHVLDAVVDVVSDLVAASDRLRVLTTSRSPLMIAAEAVYPLGPLDVMSSATELFQARARAARPTVRLDAPAVTRLCRTLDGLPLALELAAARVRTMSVEEINTRLADRFSLLRSADRTTPERHRTLHAVIEWSWQLLDEPQQIALRRLCRFPSGFTMEAAAHVAEWGALGDIASAVEGLVNQSLLTVTETDGVRYHMLETVREFGEEHLGAEAVAVTARMAAWARAQTADLAVRFHGPGQIAVVHRVDAEHDNLLAVLRTGLDNRDAATVYSVFALLGLFWAIRGAHSEVGTWAPRVLELDPSPVAPELDPNLLVLSYVLAGVHLVPGGRFRSVAFARIRVRALLRTGVRLDPSVQAFGELVTWRLNGRGLARALAQMVRAPDPARRAVALMWRANMRENYSDTYGSRRDALEFRALTRGGDTWGLAVACQHLGSLHAQSGNYAAAIDYYAEAADALWRLHAYEEAAQIRAFLAAALIGLGRIDEGRRLLDTQLTESTSVENASNAKGLVVQNGERMAAITAALAEAELAEGNSDTAVMLFGRSLQYLGWPEDTTAPGPSATMAAAAVLAAHVRCGRTSEVAVLAAQLRAAAPVRLAQFGDIPQAGCVGVAVGSYLIASGADAELGAALLALGMKARARQDFPSLRWGIHVAAARAVLGDEAVDEALGRAANLTRARAAEQILDLL